ncbi:TerC family protein [Stappia sp.]|jgi:predicted tellurium resistance membrane protein TerC|uniref:TerC family protein n=1 Tax=Stappia sp. TaxID=1870903 RepID=UPI003D0A4F3B
MIELLNDPAVWASLLTLTVMEIVLGIDNIIFISVLVSRLDPKQAKRARQIGLALALIFRIALLSILTVLIGLTAPVFTVLGEAISWRDLILLGGGLFLIVKGTHEIHQGIEGGHGESGSAAVAGFGAVIAQIIVIDMVFSVDSIVTAIGMAEHIEVMVAAVIISMIAMYLASGPISAFVQKHPTTKMLALAFLLLIGVALVADGLGFHIPRGYIYFAMAFSAGVEIVNILAASRRKAKHR